ncbi:MAG: SOS response-associated peptidase [Cytophagales bacterium]
MCGRASIAVADANLEQRFGAKLYGKQQNYQLPNFNVCPTTFAPVITSYAPAELQLFHWGLNFTSADGKMHKNTINARKESILNIPLFHESLHERRCIVPVTSYFEWKTFNGGKTKIPYLIKLKSDKIFALAALWVSQMDKNEALIDKFVLITQPPTPTLAFIHDRMPAILTLEAEKMWLDNACDGKKALTLINGYSDADIAYYPVSNELNRSFDNKAEFINEQKYTIQEQGSLF